MDLEDLFNDMQTYGFDPVLYQYFNQLLNHRTIILNDSVEESIIEKVFLPLRDFENDNSMEPVTLIINSSGGSVSDGFFLAYYISQYSKPLNIIIPGYACSMAAVLLAAGGKNENVIRSCFPCSYCLIHDGYVALAASETKTANDIMAFSASGNGDSKTSADFAIKGGGTLWNKGNRIPNTGNSTGTVGSTVKPVYTSSGTVTECEYMFPIYYSALDLSSTAPNPGAYPVNNGPLPGTATTTGQYGSVLSLPGITLIT